MITKGPRGSTIIPRGRYYTGISARPDVTPPLSPFAKLPRCRCHQTGDRTSELHTWGGGMYVNAPIIPCTHPLHGIILTHLKLIRCMTGLIQVDWFHGNYMNMQTMLQHVNTAVTTWRRHTQRRHSDSTTTAHTATAHAATAERPHRTA